MFTMLNKIFGRQQEEGSSTLATLDKLNEVLESLEKRELFLQRKIALEIDKAKEATRDKNRSAAMQCIKRKKMYEAQIESLGNFQLRIHDQMILLESANATTETVKALRTGASAMKDMQKSMSMDDIDKTMDEINDQTDHMKQIQDALSAPIGRDADFEEDELEAELAELEEADSVEDPLLIPVAPLPAAPSKVPSKKAVPESSGDDELEALQKEMAL